MMLEKQTGPTWCGLHISQSETQTLWIMGILDAFKPKQVKDTIRSVCVCMCL